MRRALALGLFAAACARSARHADSDDMILVNAKVYTLDPARPSPASAVAIKSGDIEAVGDEGFVRPYVSAKARVVDLHGATVLPGLVDAHAHLLSLGEAMASVDLVGTRSYTEVVERARAGAADSAAGAWVVARGWDQNDWPEGQREFPSHAALSAAIPDRPSLLERIDGHAVLVNAKAMAMAGVSAATSDPAGGRILRDASGQPTGVFIDSAIDLVASKVPPPTDAQRRAWLLAATRRCASLGLTGVHDAGVDADTWRALLELAQSRQLPLRVYVMARAADPRLEELLRGGPKVDLDDGRLTLRAVKFLLDGALGSRGAALFEPYADDPKNRGLDLAAAADFEARATALMRRGFQVTVHAIGDRGNALALDALQRSAKASGVLDPRPRIEHAQVLRVQDLPRFGATGIVASMQPTHATSDMPWAEKRLGPSRIAGAYAWKSILASGGRLAFGSDFPVEEVNPLFGLYAAVTRAAPDGQPAGGWRPEEALSLEQALRAFTEGAAYAGFSETVAGRVVAGMRADLTVLDTDPFQTPPREWLKARAVMTIVGGEIVYGG